MSELENGKSAGSAGTALINQLKSVLNRLDGAKNQHYVTHAYQKLFYREDNQLDVYEKKYGKFERKGVGKVASDQYFYVFVDDNGKKRYDIEHLFGAFETTALPAIKKLGRNGTISEDERSVLSWFMAGSILRTPAALDEVAPIFERVKLLAGGDVFPDEDAAKHYFERQMGRSPARASELAAYMFGRATLAPGRQAALNLLMDAIPIAFEVLVRSQWVIVESSSANEPFVISDCGLAIVSESGGAPATFLGPDVLRFFPLSPRLCLVSTGAPSDGSIRHVHIDQGLVRKINEVMILQAKRYVMGTRSDHLAEIVATLAKKGSA